MNDTAHIKITVSGTTYPFVIDPQSYTEVDVVDFAPRATTGTPLYSELGLYLDVAQMSFAHGYGRYRYSEPESYMYTGHLVDTSHGYITLFTNPSNFKTFTSDYVRAFAIHRGVPCYGTNTGVYLTNATGTDIIKACPVQGNSVVVNDLMSNGRFLLIALSGANMPMAVSDLGMAGTVTSNTITALVNPGWTIDMFNGGKLCIYEGPGSVRWYDVVDTESAMLTISGTFDPMPVAGQSRFMVWTAAGVAGNPPNNFYRLAMFGGYYWGVEANEPWLHYWVETDASDAEGGRNNDIDAIHVGPGEFFVNNMIVFNNQLWVCREDGIWAIGDDRLAYHMMDFTDQAHYSNFRCCTVWNGFLWFNIRNTIYKYRSGLQDVTPPEYDDKLAFRGFGDWAGMVPRGRFLYLLGRSNSANTDEPDTEGSAGFGVIMKTDGVGWHKVVDIPDANANLGLYLDNVYDRLVYVNNPTTGNGWIKTIQLEPFTELPSPQFPTTGVHRLYTSYYDQGLARIPKSYASVVIDGEFPTNTSVTVSYRVDDTTTWTTLGTFTYDMQEIAFPANTIGKRIQLRLALATSNSLYTPVVHSVILKLMMRPTVKYGVSFDVIVDDDLNTPGMTKLGMSPSQIRAALRAARNSTQPITFTDIFGVSANAYLSSLRFMTVQYEDSGSVAMIARCTVVYV